MSALPAWSHDLTDDQLRAAWARIRKAAWPETFDVAMADPYYARLVASEAKHPTPQLRVVRSTWPFMAGRVHCMPPPTPTRRPVFDIKRAAAGDRDD